MLLFNIFLNKYFIIIIYIKGKTDKIIKNEV